MAGMEHLEVHSKSYLVRWVHVDAGHTISWSLQPHKKSINFGIFKRNADSTAPSVTSVQATLEHTPAQTPDNDNTSAVANTSRRISTSSARNDPSTVTEKLQRLGMRRVAWAGKCEADRVSMGHYDVPEGESGMYGLVFDNTHSKQMSKNITFVLMTYPTNAPPKSGHHIRYSQMLMQKSQSSLGTRTSPALLPVSDSSESLPHDVTTGRVQLAELRTTSDNSVQADKWIGPSFYTGVLSKKRRKRNQGHARRFFSLDFTSSTLSYYKNRNSAALRGAIPLSLAAIGVNEKSRQISIDSGTEIWILRAHSQKDFDGWRAVLEKTAHAATATTAPKSSVGGPGPLARPNAIEDRAWEALEGMVGRVAGITDAVRRLAKDTDPKYMVGMNLAVPASPSPVEGEHYFSQREDMTAPRKQFWKRTSSTSGPNPGMFRRSVSGQRTLQIPVAPPSPSVPIPPQRQALATHQTHRPQEEEVHDRCMAVLRDLDTVVAQFSSLIAESRQRRMPERPLTARGNSIDSTRSQEFFDADDGVRASQLLTIDRDSEADEERDEQSEAGDSESTSDMDGDDRFGRAPPRGQSSAFPDKPKSLAPLPMQTVHRRSVVPPSVGAPPSLISFLRKNVGKDLSTIAMPVTANEPLSLLQRQSEQLEYSELLDTATVAPSESGERLLHVAAFAISSLSNARVKERAIRKPFNPMLGETFELVREDKGFRFLAEKISHRPVRVACQAEAKDWTFTHAPLPTQKFWGKSAELITEGRCRVVLHNTGDCYSWAPATCFLRNIIAGEKYVEPVQTLTVLDETTGAKAIATFRAGGMFSGRSEEVGVVAYDARGDVMPLGLNGKWTDHLALTGRTGEKKIWTAGPLLQNAPSHYGMTSFAGTLNEITAMEAGAIPPTDSRLRPDQRAYEEGDVDKAERLKAKLEEGQRRRRKEMEGQAEAWEPRWFERVGGHGGGTEATEEVWRLKRQEGYWDVREAVMGFKGGRWDGIREVFEV